MRPVLLLLAAQLLAAAGGHASDAQVPLAKATTRAKEGQKRTEKLSLMFDVFGSSHGLAFEG